MEEMAIDASDRRLLRELQRDAAASDEVLAERLGMTPSVVRTRRAALRAAGVVLREVAIIDAALLAPEVQVLALVGFARDERSLIEAFERRMATDAAVLRCHRLTGEYEYALVIRTGDAEQYAQWVREALLADGNILHYSSFVIDATVKDDVQAAVAI
jgi:Lrp/AsnC family leucine-responsive transcriptional regulator